MFRIWNFKGLNTDNNYLGIHEYTRNFRRLFKSYKLLLLEFGNEHHSVTRTYNPLKICSRYPARRLKGINVNHSLYYMVVASITKIRLNDDMKSTNLTD